MTFLSIYITTVLYEEHPIPNLYFACNALLQFAKENHTLRH